MEIIPHHQSLKKMNAKLIAILLHGQMCFIL